MPSALIAAVLWLALSTPAAAGLTANALADVGVTPPLHARLPLSVTMTDDSGRQRTLADALAGRPTVLIFADYTCRNLCGPIVAIAAAGLAKTGLRPGQDFSLAVVGLDPKDSLDDARTMKREQIGDSALAAAAVFLRGDQAAVRTLTDALGYRYTYDSDTDQFAHPAAVYVVTKDGRLARTLSALGFDATDLRLALIEAGEGRIGGFTDHLRLLCYGYDAAAGVYSLTIRRWLALACALTVIALAAGIGFMLLSRRPPAAACLPPSAPSNSA